MVPTLVKGKHFLEIKILLFTSSATRNTHFPHPVSSKRECVKMLADAFDGVKNSAGFSHLILHFMKSVASVF